MTSLVHVSRQALSYTAAAAAGTLLTLQSALAQNPFITANDLPTGFNASTDIRTGIIDVVNFVLSFLGLIAVIMVIYAGFLMIFSAGNDESISKAKSIIIWVAIGIIVILLSYVIVNFVIDIAI